MKVGQHDTPIRSVQNDVIGGQFGHLVLDKRVM